ncbi:MAG: ATP-binding cassette, subfamily B, bacterial MsbA [Parcubacteria group bacterium Gr01-1014_91]|nr:MAG: ATP-binding cassette, subfamily B, bacterial MsbA [Parcubacteria group bacterium Gr01-1014_91]
MNAPTNSTFQNLAILWHTFRNYRLQIIILVVLSIVSATLDGIGINAVIPLISFYTNAGSGPTDFISGAIQGLFSFFHVPFSFRYLLAFILGLFMLRAVMITLSGYIRGRIGADFMGKESEGMLKRMLHASWAFLLKQKIGTLQATLVRDIQRTENLLSVFGQIIQSFSGLLIYLLVALNISPIMTVSTLFVGIVLLFAIRPLMVRIQSIGNVLIATEKSYLHFLGEHIIGMKAVKAAGAEERAISSGGALVRLLRTLSIRMSLIRSLSGSLFQPFSLIFVIILFAITYRLPDFSMISFAAALYLIQKIFTYLESGQGALNGIRESIPYAQNVDAFKRLLDEHREQDAPNASPFAFEQTIEFKNVSFSYVDGKKILSDTSFLIAKGETVGLIGPSGAGKTSVADLLLRLFSPNEGGVLIDGGPITSISSESWRNNIGYVAQDVFLLNASIEDNIRFYRTELSAEDVIDAAKQANIYDFINGLPEGFKTITGDRGVMLSGGQRQRIALARALAGNPSLLILDEATSALDHESEKLIHESIRSLHGKITVLIIAHRPSTVAEADAILVLHHGSIIERGSPRELLQNPDSYFSKMQRA